MPQALRLLSRSAKKLQLWDKRSAQSKKHVFALIESARKHACGHSITVYLRIRYAIRLFVVSCNKLNHDMLIFPTSFRLSTEILLETY